MPSANLDLVRAIYSDWERGDFSRVDWADAGIEYVIADGPSPRSWRGLAEIAAGFGDALSGWEKFRTEADEYLELDEERVLVLNRASGRGKTSGMRIEQIGAKGAALFHLGDGSVTKVVSYLDRANAFADLGLTPDGKLAPMKRPKGAGDIYGESWIDRS
jgi:ketosteroid isomerase-like protein